MRIATDSTFRPQHHFDGIARRKKAKLGFRDSKKERYRSPAVATLSQGAALRRLVCQYVYERDRRGNRLNNSCDRFALGPNILKQRPQRVARCEPLLSGFDCGYIATSKLLVLSCPIGRPRRRE